MEGKKTEGQGILPTLVEFLGIALGPLHEVILYELDEKNNGTVIQVELSMGTATEVGDPMPKDLTRLLDRGDREKVAYVTGLTALYGGDRMANMSYLNLPVGGKHYLLCLLADSTDYYDMAVKLLRISNLNEKVDLETLPPGKVAKENVIRINTILRPQQENEPAGVQGVAVGKVEAAIREIMGANVGVQPAYTQEKRVEIVERLYGEDVFKIKGMVREVARRLFCSDATVYRYLSYLNK